MSLVSSVNDRLPVPPRTSSAQSCHMFHTETKFILLLTYCFEMKPIQSCLWPAISPREGTHWKQQTYINVY